MIARDKIIGCDEQMAVTGKGLLPDVISLVSSLLIIFCEPIGSRPSPFHLYQSQKGMSHLSDDEILHIKGCRREASRHHGGNVALAKTSIKIKSCFIFCRLAS